MGSLRTNSTIVGEWLLSGGQFEPSVYGSWPAAAGCDLLMARINGSPVRVDAESLSRHSRSFGGNTLKGLLGRSLRSADDLDCIAGRIGCHNDSQARSAGWHIAIA
jgi:hypothetical protein